MPSSSSPQRRTNAQDCACAGCDSCGLLKFFSIGSGQAESTAGVYRVEYAKAEGSLKLQVFIRSEDQISPSIDVPAKDRVAYFVLVRKTSWNGKGSL